MQKKTQTNDPSGVPAKENTVHYLRLCRLFSTAWFFRRSNTLFVISVMSNYHELPCFIFSPHPICVSSPPSAISAICNHGHSRLPLFFPFSFQAPSQRFARHFISSRTLVAKKTKKTKILIVFLHTRLHEQTEKQANRQLLTKKNPLEADSLF